MKHDPMTKLEDFSQESSLLLYPTYQRRFSLFKEALLESPVMYDVAQLQVPKFSTYHYVDMDGLQVGPHHSDPLLTAVPGIKHIHHVREMYKPEGSFIKIPGVNAESLLINYRRVNRQIRPIEQPQKVDGDDRGIVIFNYSLLPMSWRYPANFRAEYLRFSNIYRTIYKTIEDTLGYSARHQFIDVPLSDRMPVLAKLREYVRDKTESSLKALRSHADYMLADLFTWIGPHRERSLLSQIDPRHYHLVNLIVRKNDTWVVINLKWLDSRRKDPNAKPGEKTGVFEPKLMEAKLLMLFVKLNDIATSLYSPDEGHDGDDIPVSDVDTDEIDDALDAFGVGGYVDDNAPTAGLVDEKAELDRLEKELEELEEVRETAKDQEVMDIDEDTTAETQLYDIDGYAHGDEEGSAILIKAEELLSKNAITPATYKRLMRVQERFETIPDPYGGPGLLTEVMQYRPEDTVVVPKEVAEDEVLLDPSMKYSRVDSFHENYLKNTYRKDMLNVISAIQKFPVAITDYKVVDKSDARSSIEEHVIKVVPAIGESSVLRIPVNKVDPDGTFLYSNVRYRMRPQRRDLPIRKISPTEVVLSSYAGKCFVRRSQLARFNYAKWLVGHLQLEATNSDTEMFKNPKLSRVARYDIDLPWMYTTVASVLAGFEVSGIRFVFNYNERQKLLNLTDDELKVEKNGRVIAAKDRKGLVIMTRSDELIRVNDQGEESLGSLTDLLGLDVSRAPIPMAELKIYSKMIPLGVALAYLGGLSNMIRHLKIKVRRTLPGARMALQPSEFVLRFKNETLIVDGSDPMSAMLMSGWIHYGSVIKQYDIALFDHQDVYMPLLERSNKGTPGRYLRELDAMNVGFIDPITADLLKNMGEPTEYVPLLLRAAEMLLTEHVPTKLNDERKIVELTERVVGYERIPGTVYETLFKAMRTYAARANRSDARVEVNPMEVIMNTVSDPTVAPANNINPIHSLREREVITFGGRGGRSKRAMVARTRLYAPEDKGFISEASVDSGDVGIITYLAPNANITTTRGTVRLHDEKRDGNSMLLSTSVQLAPMADGDVPKRQGFISVQLGHQIATKDVEMQSARTGAERTTIGRMTPEFGQTAKGDGKVTEVSDSHIAVEYKDGLVERFKLGLIQVSAEGSFYPHELKSTLSVGDKVKKGDVLLYNASFFHPSELDKGKVDYSFGLTAYVCFREANYTIEDSCAISNHFSQRMGTTVTKVATAVVDFDREVSKVLKVNDPVDLHTPLLQIEDAFTQDMDRDELAQALRRYSALTPTAHAVGTVTGVEVHYNGSIDAMSESLRKLAVASEKKRKEEAKLLDKPYYPNTVSRNVRINGHQLESNQALVQFFISVPLEMGVSDKLVFANQLKSTVGKVLFADNVTLDGEQLDAIFGGLSVINRTVTSVFKMGPVNTYLRYVGEDAYDMWVGSR